MYVKFCIKFPQSRMKGERHRLSPLSLQLIFNLNCISFFLSNLTQTSCLESFTRFIVAHTISAIRRGWDGEVQKEVTPKLLFSFKGVDLGYPKIFPSFNFFKICIMEQLCLNTLSAKVSKKFHCAIFCIAHPKYSNVVGILDARW